MFAVLALLVMTGIAAAQEPAAPKDGPKLTDVVGQVEEATSPAKVSTTIEILFLLTILSLAPAFLVMATSFTRIVIVLSFVRRALATQNMTILRSRGEGEIAWQSVNYDQREDWHAFELGKRFAIVDFHFHPRAEYWFDHHPTTFLSEELRAQYAPSERWRWDETSPSCPPSGRNSLVSRGMVASSARVCPLRPRRTRGSRRVPA